MTGFAGYLNDNGYEVTQDKISHFLSLKNEEIDFTKEEDILPLMKVCFCRNKKEAGTFSDYFHQYIKKYRGSYAKEKKRIQKEQTERVEYNHSCKEKVQKELAYIGQKLTEKRNAVSRESEILNIPKTQKNYLRKQEDKIKKYFTKKETSFLLSLCTEKADVSDISMKTFETLEKKIPDKAEKALLSGKSEDFDVYQKIFEVLKKVKAQVTQHENYIESKIFRETKELRGQQKELENRLQKLEEEEKRIQNELDNKLYTLSHQFKEKTAPVTHRETFKGGGAVQLLDEAMPQFMDKPFKQLTKKEKEYIYQYIRQNIVSFKTRLGRYLYTQEKRKIDMERTIQMTCKTGGIPLKLCYEMPKRNRANLILVLDISGSCREASEMLLSFMYLLKDIFTGGCRTYVFVNSLYDVTELMETDDIHTAVQGVLQSVPTKGVYSDYNRPMKMLWTNNRKYLKKDSFVLFLGDYRNNKNKEGTEWLKNIHARAKKMFFLNTDKKEKWGQGDSIAPVYSRFASMYEARTPSDLIHFIDQIG